MHICAMLEQRPDSRRVSETSGEIQRCISMFVFLVDVRRNFWILQQKRNDLRFTSHRRPMKMNGISLLRLHVL
jgi:hypothetical protein